jgi:hypothetical protein
VSTFAIVLIVSMTVIELYLSFFGDLVREVRIDDVSYD